MLFQHKKKKHTLRKRRLLLAASALLLLLSSSKTIARLLCTIGSIGLALWSLRLSAGCPVRKKHFYKPKAKNSRIFVFKKAA